MKVKLNDKEIEMLQGDEVVFNGSDYFLVSQGYVTTEGYVHPKLKRDICDALVRDGLLIVKLTNDKITRYTYQGRDEIVQ